MDVILRAQQESRRLGYKYVGAEQILLGLLAVETSMTESALKPRGLTLNVVREEVQRMTGIANDLTRFIRNFYPRDIPFRPRGKKVIESSWG